MQIITWTRSERKPRDRRVAVGIGSAAHIEAAACLGCGICAAECPAKAIELLHFKDGQVVAKVEALFT